MTGDAASTLEVAVRSAGAASVADDAGCASGRTAAAWRASRTQLAPAAVAAGSAADAADAERGNAREEFVPIIACGERFPGLGIVAESSATEWRGVWVQESYGDRLSSFSFSASSSFSCWVSWQNTSSVSSMFEFVLEGGGQLHH